ncbi:MAG: S-layer protein [Methanomicrobiales archaeon]|nr:S-layer protein [Methanomicrobiales archaeon]
MDEHCKKITMRNKRLTTSLRVLAVLVLLVGIAAPAMAGERFVSGGPDLTAAILGSNDFSPGDEITIPVTIQNSGLLEYVFTYPNQLTAADLPNTAKLMMVTLGPGDAPVTVRSDPQLLGDLAGGRNTVANFKVQIAPDAPYETYTLPLTIRYTYLMRADQYGTDMLQYFYKEQVETMNLPIRIKPEVLLDVMSVGSGGLNAGTTGYLNISLKNIGNEDGRESIVKLVQNGNSPVVPVASSVYIGDFPKNSTVPLQYKVSVSRDAEAITYPVNITVTYKNRDGDLVTTDTVTLGVPVGGKIAFTIVSPPVEMSPGERKVIAVTYRNTGTTGVNSAQARIFTVDPFTSSDDTSYLGDLAPGGEKIAHFDITADPGATVKDYGLDSEILYRDALNNDQVSDRVKLTVDITSSSLVKQVSSNPFAIVVLLLIVVAIVYFGIIRRRKKTR